MDMFNFYIMLKLKLYFYLICILIIIQKIILMRWYSVVVSISGCGPLDPGSNPGTAIFISICCFILCVLVNININIILLLSFNIFDKLCFSLKYSIQCNFNKIL